MVGVKGKYKGCNTCRVRRVKVSRRDAPAPRSFSYYFQVTKPRGGGGQGGNAESNSSLTVWSFSSSGRFSVTTRAPFAKNAQITAASARATSARPSSSWAPSTTRGVAPRTRPGTSANRRRLLPPPPRRRRGPTPERSKPRRRRRRRMPPPSAPSHPLPVPRQPRHSCRCAKRLRLLPPLSPPPRQEAGGGAAPSLLHLEGSAVAVVQAAIASTARSRHRHRPPRWRRHWKPLNP